MKNQLKLLAVLTSAALAAGCASGGGGGMQGTPIPQPTPTAEMRCVWFLPFICGWFEPGSDEPIGEMGFRFSSLAGGAARFASWSELGPHQAAEFDAIAMAVSYGEAPSGAISATSVTKPAGEEVLSRGPRYTSDKDLAGAPSTRIAGAIDVTATRAGEAVEVGIIANPYAQGWNYQSFGVWNTQGPSLRQIASFSFGAPTPASAVPSSGSASFAGKLGGFYVSPAGEGAVASADLAVHANFSTRSLGFASSGTRITQDLKASSAAPHLNLSGTLTYAPGTNTFSGTLTNAGGTMSGSSSGRFYGPAAQELGGVFTLKSPNTVETFAGAYGAKR